MIYKKFEKNDIFYNTLKARPSFEILLGLDKEVYNGSSNLLFDTNFQTDESKIFKIQQDDYGSEFKNTTNDDYFTLDGINYIKKNIPLKTQISCSYLDSSLNQYQRRRIYSLNNILDKNCNKSSHYAFSSSYGDKSQQSLNIISIPSIFFGSSIDKGTVELGFYITGALAAKLQDVKLNGELIETFGSNKDKVAGVVLYEYGIIVLTGSWDINSSTDAYRYVNGTPEGDETPKWIYWGAGFNEPNNETDSLFSLKFNGVNYVNTITLFAHAEKGDLNHSNNLTYIKYGEVEKYKTPDDSHTFSEPEKMEIKNTTKYPYENFSGSLEKQTFISKIGIYDDQKNLIGIAKVSKPIKKKENRDFTFKLKLDI